MLDQAITERIKNEIPDLSDPDLLKEIQAKGEFKSLKAGELLMDIGRYIKTLPIVLSGAIKILREDNDGNELFLYFLYPGQTCAMSINCCMANAPSEVRAVVEEDAELVLIPVDVMDAWTNQFNDWKNFVMRTYNYRFHELLNTINSIAFNKLDVRLLDYLKQKQSISKDGIIHTTHQQIAYDLNSSREVISRLLKQLEKKGGIKLGRNQIQLSGQFPILE